MLKYRRREIVTATQWHEGDPLISGMCILAMLNNIGKPCILDDDDKIIFIESGDWIIKHENGGYSMCVPSYFSDMYELIKIED